ncbi:tRNA pseudouridine(38-40) synthase TruA [Prochlorococcus marinus]|uniref:tRNA pseudouridine synthase A n=1 Tax=Prochlorococcus marinus (strain MIT 9211) TaxID=93059 RepID=TRUA_PROM4|nr:tRNA pseudouridine(38-40) synthase TruA [Prochlorococcus marinus]A9BCM2.1 RecName: Full=tRNA pseudouridine synthase A; AltName: Full=tRNA pseudouridine(38-40) synthase; AltName: Full=tRNA pseudouridylate synthase I; AltName: Full=tRNA-uridine isomerase I [Prochlorococcus marinus str. MIT 9211]ABX09584.1 tRNA pseudouridine synthase A [Prochlorococcus marinus str. MIT 9211]
METEASNESIEKSLPKRIALLIQYNGSGFCGWQRQKEGNSVQSILEEAVSSLDPFQPIKVVAAGRTDSGVHASGQVAHFDCSGFIPANRWAAALNGRLPKAIRVRYSALRPITWHACFSATYRRYRYTIYNGCKPNLFLSPWCWHRYQFRLDENLMNLALQGIKGFHDFTAFQRAGSNRPNALTTVEDVHLFRQGDLVSIDIQATGFLYGMVRLLVGQLVAVGEHRISVAEFERRWKLKLREEVREAAPPNGLSLIRVGYETMIFPENIAFDSFPFFSLSTSDPPPSPQ